MAAARKGNLFWQTAVFLRAIPLLADITVFLMTAPVSNDAAHLGFVEVGDDHLWNP